MHGPRVYRPLEPIGRTEKAEDPGSNPGRGIKYLNREKIERLAIPSALQSPACIEPDRVGEKGVVALPKALQTLAGIDENSLVIIIAEEGKIAVEPLRVTRAKPSIEARRRLEEALRGELIVEERVERPAER